MLRCVVGDLLGGMAESGRTLSGVALIARFTSGAMAGGASSE